MMGILMFPSPNGFVVPATRKELLAEAAAMNVGLRKAAEAIYERYYRMQPIVADDQRATRIDTLRKAIRKKRKQLVPTLTAK